MQQIETSQQPELIRDLPPSIRPISRLDSLGVEALKEPELLALILHSRSLHSVEQLLGRYGLKELLAMPFARLSTVRGVGPAGAAALLGAAELTRRTDNKLDNHLPVIHSTNEAVSQAMELRGKKKEYLLALFLNARKQLIGKEIISIGTLTASLAHPREIYAPAIGKAAAGLILVHNHPSGDPTPSDEDIRLTKRIAQAGVIMGIELLDHLIVAENGCHSFMNAGMLS